MNLFKILILFVLTTTSCSKVRPKSKIENSPIKTESILTPEDFINNLRIKVEFFMNDKNGYATGDKQDHQSWKTDSIDNFEGTWVSESKTLGDWAFKYKFSLLEDGRLSLALEAFKTKEEHGVTVIGKYVGGANYVFRHTMPLTVPLVMNRNSKSPIVSFTPLLSKN